MNEDAHTDPVSEDPSVGLIEQTDNGLRPEDGDQLIDGRPISDYTDEELLELAEAAGDEDA